MNNKILGEMQAVTEIHKKTAEKLDRSADDIDRYARTLDRMNESMAQMIESANRMALLLREYTPKEWLTTSELAAMLKLDDQTIWNKYKAGEIPGHQLGDKHHSIRFDRREVEEAIRCGKARYSETSSST